VVLLLLFLTYVQIPKSEKANEEKLIIPFCFLFLNKCSASCVLVLFRRRGRYSFIYAEEQKKKRTKVVLGMGGEGEKYQFLLCCSKEFFYCLFTDPDNLSN